MQDLNVAADAVQRSRLLDAMVTGLSGEEPVATGRSERRVLKHSSRANLTFQDVQVDASVLDVSTLGMSLVISKDLKLAVGDVVKVEHSGEEFALEIAWTSVTELGAILGGRRTDLEQA